MKNSAKDNHSDGASMIMPIKGSLLLLLVSTMGPTAFVPVRADGHHNDDDVILHWANNGGGWRAMASNMGFANLFGRMGLIGSEDDGNGTTTSTTKFDGISSSSGSSWGLGQLAYSLPFYERVMTNDTTELHDFVVEWMTAFSDTLEPTVEEDPACAPLKALSDFVADIKPLTQYCNILAPYNWDWAMLIEMMFDAVSTKAYDDPSFRTRSMGFDNRLAAFADLKILSVQMGMAPMSRINKNGEDPGDLVYIGPSNSDSEYSLNVPMQYVVTENQSYYTYAVDDDDLPFLAKWNASTTPAPANLLDASTDFAAYYLYPPNLTTASVLTETTSLQGEAVRDPFGGVVPTLTQILAVSSSGPTYFSPSIPSVLAQYVSTLEVLAVEQGFGGFLSLLHNYFDAIYKGGLFEDLAVCSQWPDEACGPTDMRLVDGGLTDDSTIAMTIGEHQSRILARGGDLQSTTLKIIDTYYGGTTDNNQRFLSYFDAPDYNADAQPGDFLWSSGVEFNIRPHPVRSRQVFAETLSEDAITASETTLGNNTNGTSSTWTATTIDNPAFHVLAGQKVEILYIRLALDIPIVPLEGKPELDRYIEPLAATAQGLADNMELERRVAEFIGSDDSSMTTTMAPTMSPTTMTTMLPTTGAPLSAAPTSSPSLVTDAPTASDGRSTGAPFVEVSDNSTMAPTENTSGAVCKGPALGLLSSMMMAVLVMMMTTMTMLI